MADEQPAIDVDSVLAKVEDLRDAMVLIGGQAVVFWANRYASVPEMAALLAVAPLTSRDIDFTGNSATAETVAARLHGRVEIPTRAESEAGPQTALVLYPDEHGITRRLDFIGVPLGVPDSFDEFVKMSQPVRTSVSFRVMHPFHLLRSRLTNLDRLPTHKGEHSRQQCRAAIICQREFTRETIHHHSPKAARDANERLFQYLWAGSTSIAAKSVWKDYGIDARDALLFDEALGEKFCSKRYPAMLRQLEKKWGVSSSALVPGV